MKRSQMVEEIRKILEMNGKDNGYGELEEALLHTIEELGMYPPDTNLRDCSDAEFQVYVDNIDIPHWFVLGWDDENI